MQGLFWKILKEVILRLIWSNVKLITLGSAEYMTNRILQEIRFYEKVEPFKFLQENIFQGRGI